MATAIATRVCGVEVVSHALRTCGCRGDLPRIVAALAALDEPGAFDTVVRWATQSRERRCRHADGGARLLLAALAAYPGEFEAHAAGRCCLLSP